MSQGPGTDRQRKIIHIDMDAFFASVEQRDNPDLRGKPVAVGGSRERGVVAAASYEARKFGIHSAMPSKRARRLCPDLIFVPPRFDVYREVSRQIRDIFAEYSPLIEPMSLDEAYLDVTENLKGLPTATAVAKAIKADIKARTDLTASAGVAASKFLAKMASDFRKPDGLYVITPDMGPGFVETLEIGKFHGIGPATESKMKEMGIFTGKDLKAQPLSLLQERFGKAGTYFYCIARGIDERPVQPDRPRKSIGAENTFSSDLRDYDDLAAEIVPLAEKVWKASERHGCRGKTVTLKVKFADFHQITRSQSLQREYESEEELVEAARRLLGSVFPVQMGIRLIGVTLSGFPNVEDANTPKEEDAQLSLF